MISIKNLSKKFGNHLALNNLSLEINDGESYAFIGGNGSGKTTLLEIIAGIQEQTIGEILINNEKVSKAKSIGIQFQEGAWPKGTSANDILEFYLGKQYKKNLRSQELIEIFEIEKFIKKDLNNLSGGQKQRFNAMLAIVNEPQIVILDELITGLDLKMQIKLINFFKDYKLNNNCTLLVITHMPEEVELMCDRVCILDSGSLIYDGKVSDVISKHKTVRQAVTKHYMGEEI